MKVRTIALILTAFLTASCNNRHEHMPLALAEKTDTTHVNKKAPVLIFGLPSDPYNLSTGHIKPNGFLSQILTEHGVTMQEIEQVTRNSASVFDVRNIRAGNHYTLFCDTDSRARARFLVYEHDPTTSYIFSFRDSLNITLYKKEVTKIVRFSSGTIETSLWDAMISGGMHPSLASRLSDIFAWTVDFFGLQKGDSYKVIYEESFIDDKSLGAERIYGAQFTWSGKTVLAVPFTQDGRESYFDEDGKSLRKAFLKAPLSFSRISSRFSSARMHPILRIVRPHYGVDYAAPVGTPVHAIGDGRIISATFDGESGRMVKISHNSVYTTAYLHLSGFGDGIHAGGYVKQGDIIGYVGTSGLSTGPHLDFRIYQNGYPVDPLKVEATPVEPVSDSNRVSFEINKKVVQTLLSTF